MSVEFSKSLLYWFGFVKSTCGPHVRLGLLWVSTKNAGFSFVSVPLVRFLLWPSWLFPIVPWPEVSRFSVKVLATCAVPLCNCCAPWCRAPQGTDKTRKHTWCAFPSVNSSMPPARFRWLFRMLSSLLFCFLISPKCIAVISEGLAGLRPQAEWMFLHGAHFLESMHFSSAMRERSKLPTLWEVICLQYPFRCVWWVGGWHRLLSLCWIQHWIEHTWQLIGPKLVSMPYGCPAAWQKVRLRNWLSCLLFEITHIYYFWIWAAAVSSENWTNTSVLGSS